MEFGALGQDETPHFHPQHRHPPSCMHKLGMAPSVACECGAEEQAIDNVLIKCPIHQPLKDGTA